MKPTFTTIYGESACDTFSVDVRVCDRVIFETDSGHTDMLRAEIKSREEVTRIRDMLSAWLIATEPKGN